jgi:UDP-N-acetylmuramyl pentapeptide phosphotransferase/UDP-N-acetylglucosamine-1-phosphate transferase
MIYLLIAALLFLCMLAYFKIADRYNIIDKPNQRSSHKTITIRGGGVVFPLSMILYAIFFHQTPAALLAGMLMISLVSFWDDISSLPNKVRLLVHLLSVSGLLWAVQAFGSWPVWLIIIAYILIIGTINAYNFMDGINGITGVYSLVVLCSLWYLNTQQAAFTDSNFIICPVVACLVFLFFNFRKKAKCFAGDVGSVSIAFWIIAILIMAVIQTQELKYLLFLSVYGVDAVLTILHRLLLKQNIFEAHRLHFYQILANERKVPHLTVAVAYGVVQLLSNAVILFTDLNFISSLLLVCVPLVLIYIGIKPRLMTKTVIL